MSRRLIIKNSVLQGPAGSGGATGPAGPTGATGPQGVTVLFAALADSAIVANSAALTALYTNSAQIPANPANGTIFKVRAAGYIDATGGAAATLAVGLYLDGTTTLIDSAGIAVAAGQVSRFAIDFYIVVRDNSAAGKWQPEGHLFFEALAPQALSDGAAPTINGTVAHFINPALQWNVTNANNKAWFRTFCVEKVQ